MSSYGSFASALPDDKSGRGGPKPKRVAKRLEPDVHLIKKSVIVLAGEGPTQIARRISDSMGGAPISWADIVQQNLRYFKNVKNLDDINSKFFNSNRDLQPGMIIHYQALIWNAPAVSMAGNFDPITVDDPTSDDAYSFAATGNLKVSGSIEFIFGIDRDNFKASLGIGIEVSAGGKFLLDKNGFSSDTAAAFKPKVALFFEAETGFDLGPVDWGASLKGEIDPTTGDYSIALNRSLDWEFEQPVGTVPFKLGGKEKKLQASSVSAISFKYFQFEYDSEKHVTKIGVTIEATDEFEGIIPLGNPFMKLKLKLGGSGSADFYIELPGDQQHLKPRTDQGIEQPNLAIPTFKL